jgi:hypothetical protein
MNRILLGAGIEPASKGSRHKRENWWGVEMMRFLKFCRDPPPGSSLDDCFRGYGAFLKTHDPPLEPWRIEQVREALRVFRRGIVKLQRGQHKYWHALRSR